MEHPVLLRALLVLLRYRGLRAILQIVSHRPFHPVRHPARLDRVPDHLQEAVHPARLVLLHQSLPVRFRTVLPEMQPASHLQELLHPDHLTEIKDVLPDSRQADLLVLI